MMVVNNDQTSYTTGHRWVHNILLMPMACKKCVSKTVIQGKSMSKTLIKEQTGSSEKSLWSP